MSFNFANQPDADNKHGGVTNPNRIGGQVSRFGFVDTQHQEWVVGNQDRDETSCENRPEVKFLKANCDVIMVTTQLSSRLGKRVPQLASSSCDVSLVLGSGEVHIHQSDLCI